MPTIGTGTALDGNFFRSGSNAALEHDVWVNNLIEGILAENIILRKWLSMNVYQLQHIGRNTFIENNF